MWQGEGVKNVQKLPTWFMDDPDIKLGNLNSAMYRFNFWLQDWPSIVVRTDERWTKQKVRIPAHTQLPVAQDTHAHLLVHELEIGQTEKSEPPKNLKDGPIAM